MFDLTDVDEMQKKLYPEYQVVVLSASHGNAVISRSPPTKTIGMQEVVVYHCMDHFDLITNLEGFLMSGQYCEHCEKAYSHKERHHCSGTCPYCFRSNDMCITSTMQSCAVTTAVGNSEIRIVLRFTKNPVGLVYHSAKSCLFAKTVNNL